MITTDHRQANLLEESEVEVEKEREKKINIDSAPKERNCTEKVIKFMMKSGRKEQNLRKNIRNLKTEKKISITEKIKIDQKEMIVLDTFTKKKKIIIYNRKNVCR